MLNNLDRLRRSLSDHLIMNIEIQLRKCMRTWPGESSSSDYFYVQINAQSFTLSPDDHDQLNNDGYTIAHVEISFRIDRSTDPSLLLFRRSGPYTEATAEYIRNGGRYALATAVLDSIVLVFTVVVAFLLR